MSPTPRYEPGIPNEIVATVKEVGEMLIALELGDDYSPSRDWQVLDGNCHENAYHLAEALLERGYTAYLVWGAVRSMKRSPLFIDTIDQLERTTRVHFWVEIDPETIDEADHPLDEITTPVVAELSSHALGHENCPYVALQRPGRYQRMGVDPSYIRFERSFDSEDLISKASYQRLRERSPELFSTNPWDNDGPDAYESTHNTDPTSTQ